VLDTALSRALLMRVAAGELPATLRLARSAPAVIFGKQDAVTSGYDEAVRAARGAGFEAALRLAGGRAAVFHEQTISLGHAVPDPSPRRGIHARFEATANVIARALGRLGVDAHVGEVPGEYCPGSFSVHARGERKLAGIGQRLIATASFMGGVLVVADAARVRDVLDPVYAALGLDWDPARTGAIADEGSSDVSWDTVCDALLAEYGQLYDLVDAKVDEPTLALAEQLAPEHRPRTPDAV
jgi:octanoyl-[GcvH]:protein N-octanoyltransferase